MKRNAIMRIILWSIILVVLLAIFFILIYVPGASPFMREDVPAETWIPVPLTTVPPDGSAGNTVVTETDNVRTKPSEDYPSQANTVKTDAAQIREMEIEWVSGSIVIQPADTDEIAFWEEDIHGSGKPMQWKIRDNKIAIQFSENMKISLGTGLNWNDINKNLIIEVPADWQCDSLEVDTAAASLTVSGLTVREMEFAGASGTCVFDNCTVEKLDLDTASGDVLFKGSLAQMECDAASADILLELSNVPRSLDLDTASGDLDVVLPADAGFTVSMDTMSGDFESDFDTTIRNGNYVAGNGRCRIDVDAMSGDVSVRKGA